MQRCFQSKYLGSNSAEGLHFSAFHQNVIMYLARDIPAFVMYCVYGESGSSLYLQSTDSDYNTLLLLLTLLNYCDSVSLYNYCLLLQHEVAHNISTGYCHTLLAI